MIMALFTGMTERAKYKQSTATPLHKAAVRDHRRALGCGPIGFSRMSKDQLRKNRPMKAILNKPRRRGGQPSMNAALIATGLEEPSIRKRPTRPSLRHLLRYLTAGDCNRLRLSVTQDCYAKPGLFMNSRSESRRCL